jgi:uncharacterized protein (DUF697 family)
MTLSTLFARRKAQEALATPLEIETVDVAKAGAGALLCRDQAKKLIHKYAVFGTMWAVLPVPMATSAGLTLLETHLIYWVARVYGEHPKKTDVLMTAAGLELASVALKTVAMEGAALVPVIGLGVKATIAGTVVEALGHAVVQHYEAKYPNKAFVA